VWLDVEVLKNPKIERRGRRKARCVPGEAERARRKRKGARLVVITPGHRVHGTARTDREDWCHLNVAERSDPGAWLFTWCAILVFPDRQVEERTGDEPMPLVVQRVCPFIWQRVRVLRQFVEVRRGIPRV
jgi:hypothetical protein